MSKRAYPLSWPEGWKRTKMRVRATFGRAASTSGNARIGLSRLSVADAVHRLLVELDRMGIGAEDVLISTNVQLRIDGLPRSDREPTDPGAAVYWNVAKGKTRAMAIDKYDRVADNLAAIAATLEAMRAIERHGGAEILDRAFLGFAALPEKASQPWREVLGIEGAATLALVEARYRTLVKVRHPDVGGDRDEFEKLQQAREAARVELAS